MKYALAFFPARSVFLLTLIAAPTASSFGQEKAPLPPEAAQAKALGLVKEIYGEQWRKAKTSAQKTALAAKLLAKANESTDPANRYVLLKVARDVAAQAGDAELAFKAIDAMAARYDVDVYKLKGAALSTAAKSVSSQKHVRAVAERALLLMEQAVEKDDFAAAKYLGKLALDAARKGRDYKLVRQIIARNKEVEKIATAYADIQDASATLESNPVDPEANLAVGKYRCLVKGNWDRGVPMLALGSDDKLKELAVEELEEVAGADDQLALGDGWWELALASEGMAKEQLEGRARFWYRKALPGLNGLVKDRVEKRLKDFSGPVASSGDDGASHPNGGTLHEPARALPTLRPANNLTSRRWLTIFRSADPSIWNTNTTRGENNFAVAVQKVPNDIDFLKMSIPGKNPVVIRIAKNELTAGTKGQDRFRWHGKNNFQERSHHLGIYCNDWLANSKKDVFLYSWRAGRKWAQGKGWGFGTRWGRDDRQGYTWAGREIGKTVFEIAVKPGPLTPKESMWLLK